MDQLGELPSLERRVTAGLSEIVRDVLRAEAAQTPAGKGGDELLGSPDMPTSGLRCNVLSKRKFPVAIPEFPFLVGHCLFYYLLILVSIRKRGFPGMPDQPGCVQP